MNPNILIFFLPFAVFGFTYLLRHLDGPFDILKRTRMLFGIKYVEVLGQDGEVESYIEEIPDTPLARLFGCFWCLSTWVSIMLCGVFALSYKFSILVWITIVFACIGIAGFLYEKVRHD
jgi:arabinogalactan endo-1,4-beta-galactosidase